MSCGIPGCKYAKYTPGGNKSFKCDFWKLQSQKNNERISLEVSANHDPEVLRMRGVLDIASVHHSATDYRDHFEYVLGEDYVPPNNPAQAEKPMLTPVDENQLDSDDKKIENLPSTDLSILIDDKVDDDSLKQKFKLIHQLFSEERSNEQQVQPSVKQEPAKPEFLTQVEKRILQLENRINDFIDIKEDTENYGLVLNNTPTYKLRITYNRLLRYSKFLATDWSLPVKKKPRFLVSNDVVKIKHLLVMFPHVFRPMGEIDYGKDNPDPHGFLKINYSDWPQILIVPDFNFITTSNRNKKRVAYFSNENYKYPHSPKDAQEILYDEFFVIRVLHQLNDVKKYNYQFKDTANLGKNWNGITWKDWFIKKFASNLEEFNNNIAKFNLLE